jgi:hypothetical protein
MMGLSNQTTAIQSGQSGDENAPPDRQPQAPAPQTGPTGPTYDPLTHAVMLGSAQMASDAAGAKATNEEAEKEAKAKPVEITAKIDPATGDRSFTFKNVRPGPNLDKIQEAITAPHKDAEQGIASTQLNSGIQALEQVLSTMKAPGEDVFHDDATKYRGGYRASRELGANPLQALVDGIRVAVGGISKGSVQNQVDRSRALRKASVVKQFLPLVNAATTERRLDNEETRIADSQKKNTLRDALDTINATDFSQVAPEDRYSTIADQLGVAPEDLSPGMRGRIDRKARQDDRKRSDAEFESFRKDKGALSIFPNFDEVKKSYGKTLKPDQESQLHADYDAARTDYQIKQKNEQLKIEAADRQSKRLDISIANNPLAGPSDKVTQSIDYLIDQENQGKDMTKVSPATYARMVQRRSERAQTGDPTAALPDKYTPAAQKSLAESSQVLDESRRLKSVVDSYIKEHPEASNLPFDKALANLAYRAGYASADQFNSRLAELSILGLKSAATVGAKGVRNWKYINMTLQHTAEPGKDSLKLMSDKLGAIVNVNEDTIAANKKFGLKSGVVAPSKATHRFNKATGKIEAIQQ